MLNAYFLKDFALHCIEPKTYGHFDTHISIINSLTCALEGTN